MTKFPGGLAAILALGLAVAVLGYDPGHTPTAPAPVPAPYEPAPAPGPEPAPAPKPKPRRPWAEQAAAVAADEPAVDLLSMPTNLRPRNVGGRDGAGLCVFTSIQYAAEWQNEPRLWKLQSQMRRELGGGYPAKVDKMIAKYGSGAKYIQYQGKDPAVIQQALKNGQVPCITWQSNHMLCCVAYGAQCAILDNNDPSRLHWYDQGTFLSKWRAGGGGWAFVLLNPGPPPPPRNVRQYYSEARPAPKLPRLLPLPLRRRVLPSRGVQWKPPVGEMYTYNGRRVSRRMIRRLLGADLPDTSRRPRLTIIGPKADCDRVSADLARHPGLASIAPLISVQCYNPGVSEMDWALQCGFVTSGRPTIYWQEPNGRVLYRADSYPGPDVLYSALRRAQPGYDPTKDPSGQASPIPLPDLSHPLLRSAALAAVAIVVSLYLAALLRRRAA